MEFQNQKRQRLGHVDLSRKGSVDEPIAELVVFVNSLANYFTTSSCSGRVIVFEGACGDDDAGDDMTNLEKSEATGPKASKKGCKWLYVSHRKLKDKDGEDSLKEVQGCGGNASFKFEAMVMHIQCQSLEDAQKMHQAAVSAGFRNSGISVGGKRKIILGVRSTHGIEAPLTKDGVMLVTPEYYKHLVECANAKMEENFIRINRFFENVKLLKTKDASQKESKKPNKEKEIQMKKNKGSERREALENNANSNISHGDDDRNQEMNDLSLFMFENT